MPSNWVALFSGGKDSSWALYRAQLEGINVVRTMTAQPAGDSYLFHTPATDLAALLSESMGIPHTAFAVETAPADESIDSSRQGDRELEALEEALIRLDTSIAGGVDGIITGVVASRFQRDRVDRLCSDHDLDLYDPLWECDPEATLQEMIDTGFDIRIIAVAAGGLDRSWLGRTLDTDTVAELCELAASHGVHPMGEGGEYETLVVDGPHLRVPLQFEARKIWDGTRGRLEITDATLAGD